MFFFFLMIRRPPRSTLSSSSAASDVYKRQVSTQSTGHGKAIMAEEEHTYKIVVAGDGGVGKSALTLRLCSGKFPKKYDPTIEDSYRKKLEVEKKVCTLDILDTAGQEEYRTLRGEYMVEGRGFVLVYSITDTPSFEAVDEFKDQIDKACAKIGVKVPIVLVANKCDLNEARSITTKQGEHKVKEWKDAKTKDSAIGDIVFMEASAKEDINVSSVFETLVKKMNQESGTSAPEGTASSSAAPKEATVEESDKPATTDEDKKGGGCKCSIM
eukprot:TRINITY_DN20528_c0_g1_i1.p1 TRINITY_DN20528_c0_g1~~TRINITY_DN20528_c0_g1_i1.p1  ORF type:complete len:270 (+),score=89.27 TRINITY_DN20528_c0_g1_i1:101-910(+)